MMFVEMCAALSDELFHLGFPFETQIVAGRLLEELQDGQVHLEGSAGFIREYLASHIENDDKKIRKFWKKFASIKLRC